MSVELKNWKELCKEKDERIKELEGKFDLIVERLESEARFYNSASYTDQAIRSGVKVAIEIVKGVINERD